MVTNRILLFGGNGQVGKAFQRLQLPSDWQLNALTHAECDLMQPSSIGKVLQDFAPDIVINAAAMTDVEACEQDRDRAKEINFHAVANIAGQCDTLSAPLIHLSTDYVFDGMPDADSGSRGYLPDDAMNPKNVYGETKFLGEEAVRHGLHWHVIVRTSMIFSADGTNILTKALKQIDTQEEVIAAQDQKANPTSARVVAESLLTIATAIMHGKGNGFGTFHIGGEPAVSRFEFLQAVMNAYAPYTDRRPKLTAVAAAAMPNRAPRPPCSILNCDKAGEVYGIFQQPWHDDLLASIREYVAPHTTGQTT